MAARLKYRHETVAEAHPQVTVLFADRVGFTALASELPPGELLDLLNRIFSRFDASVGARGVEKGKTIGDLYMVVAGAPEPLEDHAIRCALLALDMNRAVGELEGEMGHPLTLRIGLHSGEVVAGVIGTRRFAYDLCGETVDTAARMETMFTYLLRANPANLPGACGGPSPH